MGTGSLNYTQKVRGTGRPSVAIQHPLDRAGTSISTPPTVVVASYSHDLGPCMIASRINSGSKFDRQREGVVFTAACGAGTQICLPLYSAEWVANICIMGTASDADLADAAMPQKDDNPQDLGLA